MEPKSDRQDEDDRDRALMLAAKSSDVHAFATLASLYRAPLSRFFYALLGDPTVSEDAAQEVLLRVWTLRERYEPTGRFSAYLFTLARNHARNLRERHRYRAGHEDAACDADLLPTREPLPEAVLLNRLDHAALQDAINALPPIYQAVFLRSHVDGLRYADIAEQLDIPIGTVKSRMAQALVLLRRALALQEKEL